MSAIIGFHYTLKDKDGAQIDSSRDGNPMLFMTGKMAIIPAVEKKLEAMKMGEKAHISVEAKDAYGEVREDLKLTVKKNQFPKDAKLTEGMQFRVNQDPNMPPFTIVKIQGDDVAIDGNHPMAGVDLEFDVEVTEKRLPTAEELAHGHAHGPGGHQH